jgi:hypothetical protein
MKTILAILATVVPLVAVVLAWHLANSSAPDLRYQLSSPIEIPTSIGTRTSTQQIEVANIGKASAQPVQIKIKKKVNKPVVIKDSEADNYREFDNPTGSVELVYDNLRPNGRLKVVTAGDALTDQDLEIRDQTGPAKIAFASQSSSWPIVADIALFSVMGFYLLLSARGLVKEG